MCEMVQESRKCWQTRKVVELYRGRYSRAEQMSLRDEERDRELHTSRLSSEQASTLIHFG